MSEPNSTSDLQQTLQRLHQELSAAQKSDESSRRLLRQALHDIELTLGQQRPVPQAPRALLGEFAVRFEGDHPALAAGIREFLTLLGSAGI